MRSLAFFVSILLSTSHVSHAQDNEGIYKVGVGIGDITGPPAGVVLNGYVSFTDAAGIFTRQFARGFVVQSKTNEDDIVAYVTCDMGMMDHSIKSEVVKRLVEKFGNKFSEKNVMLSATHTHSGVSGFMTYFSYLLIESRGFNPITFWSTVDGITEAIDKAMSSLVDGRLYWNRGELNGVSHNRRSQAYDLNPEEEREHYSSNVDKDMVLLKLVAEADSAPIGAFNWLPLHPISFGEGDNPFVSSDNKGYAATLFEYWMNPGQRPGKGKFVAGFGSSNLGDVSPAHDIADIKAPDKTHQIAKCKNNGMKQFSKAKELFEDEANLQPITGPIRFAHQYVQPEEFGLCKAAMGYAYLGLDPIEAPWLDWIRDLIKEPSPEMVACQAPKLVALAAGEMDQPWEWSPSTFSLQLLQIGNFDLVGVPGEFSTMSGRRIRNAVFNVTNHEVVIAGLTNMYINYVVTPEEYDLQEYEAGITLYGRNTTPVLVQIFQEMAAALENGQGDTIPDGTPPPSFLDNVRDTIDPWVDPLPSNGRPFGSVVVDTEDRYSVGETVNITFNAGSPRNSPLRGGTFLVVDKMNEETSGWTIHRTDADIDTLFWWDRITRRIEVNWFIPEDTEAGSYRIRHFGYYRQYHDGPFINYEGTGRTFIVN